MRHLVTLLLLFLWIAPSHAQSGINIVRDTEIENILKQWSAPMWRAAGLNPKAVDIILVQDRALNAFTAGGQSIFITTGLIQKTTSPDEVIGVLAHETGHIVGGHVLTRSQKARGASYEALLSTVLGIGVGILSGSGDAAVAISSFGRSNAIGGFLAHSRIEESSADQAALTYLDNAGLPSTGLTSFMQKLADQELLPASQQVAFARTHPITRDRITALKARSDKIPKVDVSDDQQAQLEMIKAKLIAFTDPSRVEGLYGDRNDAIGMMTNAIANYRQNKIDNALKAVDAWIALEPNNGYAYELKGQILKDATRPREAVQSYDKALEIIDNAPLIRIETAHAMIESGDDTLLDKAIDQLNMAILKEPRNSFAFRLLSTAYGRKKMTTEAQVYLAEYSILQGDTNRAEQLLTRAIPNLSSKSPVSRRARDLKLSLDNLDKDDKDT